MLYCMLVSYAIFIIKLTNLTQFNVENCTMRLIWGIEFEYSFVRFDQLLCAITFNEAGHEQENSNEPFSAYSAKGCLIQ